MGQYNFVNPGSAVADRVEDILTKQRDEQRRAMLDEITRQQAESGMAVQADNLRTSALNRRVTENALEHTLAQQATANALPGDDTSTWAPERQEAAKKLGLVGKNPKTAPKEPMSPQLQSRLSQIQQLQREVGASPDTMRGVSNYAEGRPYEEKDTYFLGNKAEREEEATRGRLDELVRNNPNADPNIKSIVDFYKAIGAKTIPASVGNLFQKREQMSVYDEESNKARGLTDDVTGEPIMGAPGAARTVITRNRPPRAPQGPQPQAFSHTDAQGNTKWTWVRPGQPIPEDARRGNPAIPRARGAILPQGTSQKLADLRAKANTTDLANDQYFAAVTNAIAMANVSDPSVKYAVQNVIDDIHPITQKPLSSPENPRGPRAQELGAELSQQEGATATEIAEFIALLLDTRGY